MVWRLTVHPGPTVGVVVATRRRADLLARCIQALVEQDTDQGYEVVVVNDDDTPVSLAQHEVVRVVPGPCRGVAAARNVGIAATTAPLIAFTDDDAVPSRGWISAMVAASERYPDAVAFDGPIETGPLDPLYHHAPEAVPGSLVTANAVYRRRTLETVGLFDERFHGFWGLEDIELAARAARAGPIRFVDDMIVVHPPRPIGLLELFGQGRSVEGQWMLFRTHPSLSNWRLPLRWGPVLGWFRGRLRWLSPGIVRGSPARALRAVALVVGTTAVAFWTALRRWSPPP